MSSKAQGLSLNTVVIAAIVLIVLLLLIGMTTGYFGKWGVKFKTISETSCKGQGGEAVAKTSSCPWPTKDAGGFYDDVKEDQKCCVPRSCEERGGYCKNACGEDYIENPWPGCGSKKCCGYLVSNDE